MKPVICRKGRVKIDYSSGQFDDTLGSDRDRSFSLNRLGGGRFYRLHFRRHCNHSRGSRHRRTSDTRRGIAVLLGARLPY